jgi:hypothetical protein
MPRPCKAVELAHLTLGHAFQVVQLNSLRPTNDAFCASLRTRLKASLPMMKSLKPFSHTFFSEHFLNQLEGDAKSEPPTPIQEVEVADLLQLGDDMKGKGKAEDEQREYTTEHGTGKGFHSGL